MSETQLIESHGLDFDEGLDYIYRTITEEGLTLKEISFRVETPQGEPQTIVAEVLQAPEDE